MIIISLINIIVAHEKSMHIQMYILFMNAIFDGLDLLYHYITLIRKFIVIQKVNVHPKM